MKPLLLMLAAASSIFADSIVSGIATYDTNIGPLNSQTSFDLALNGGQFSSIDVTHEFQIGAKGSSNEDFTKSFAFSPIPYYAVGVIGIATDFAVVLNGVTYSQSLTPFVAGSTPADGSTFTVTLSFTQISGTNIVDTTQDSTAIGLFAVSGSIAAFIENGNYTFPLAGGTSYADTFNGYATFNGSYAVNGNLTAAGPQPPQLMESYTFSPAPEPGTIFQMLTGLAVFVVIARTQRVNP